jgi:hypothetical protein
LVQVDAQATRRKNSDDYIGRIKGL